jgi:hypothetical protein
MSKLIIKVTDLVSISLLVELLRGNLITDWPEDLKGTD